MIDDYIKLIHEYGCIGLRIWLQANGDVSVSLSRRLYQLTETSELADWTTWVAWLNHLSILLHVLACNHKTFSATFPGSMEEGRVEGKHEANTETAQRLLAMGLSAEQVAKATQLPLEIIKNLSNSKNSSFACKLHTLQVSEHHGIPTCPRHQKSITSPHALKGAFGPSART